MCLVTDALPWHRRSHAGRWLHAIPFGRVATPHARSPTPAGSTSATRARARTGRARTTVGSGLRMEQRGNTAQAVLAVRYSASIAGAGVRCARPGRLRGRAPTPGDRVRARPGDAWRTCSHPPAGTTARRGRTLDERAKRRATSTRELIDCRLALSLDDLAVALAARDIVDAEWSSAYRPAAELGCTAKYRGEQHCAALAVAVTSFGKRDGTRLVVARDFHGKIGTLTCGTGEPPRNELWRIACDAAGRQFQVVLTPNWNAEHHAHLHLELTAHDWVLAR